MKLLHTFQQVNEGGKIILKIQQWVFHGFANCLVSSKVNNTGDIIIFLENGKRIIKVAKVNFIVFYFFACYLLYPFQDIGV